MGPKVNIHLEKASAQSQSITDRTPKSGESSSRQGLFQSVLSKIQEIYQQPVPQETNSPQTEKKSLQMAVPVSKPGGKTRFALQRPGVSRGEGASPVTAATTSRGSNPTPRAGALASVSMVPRRGGSTDALDETAAPEARSFRQLRKIPTHSGIGSLSAQFESGGDGVDSIGYDDQGGTSYGAYQIASRPGTMRLFIDYLRDQAPDWARRLDGAGPLNTGGRKGTAPREWRRIAMEDPERFARLQQDFISQTHYVPALQEIQERTGIDLSGQSSALQEVLWSTAVQHGPRGAARIFSNAIGETDPATSSGIQFEQRLIDRVYSARGRQFGGSSGRVASAVKRRFEEERGMALDMLKGEGRPRSFRA
jgi:hypothetical protein